jgi:hypothetical protein
VAVQSYDQSSIAVALNHSDLFNAMIYPFTRTVIYGVIWYQGNELNCIYCEFLFTKWIKAKQIVIITLINMLVHSQK